jgi:hypothetical protein
VAFEFGANSIAEYSITPAEMARFWVEQGYQVYGINGVLLSEADFAASAQVQNIWDYVAVPAEDWLQRTSIANVLSRPPAWPRVTVHLDAADHEDSVVGRLPHLRQYHGLKRWLALRIAGLILKATRVITNPQRSCNQALMRSMRALVAILRDRDGQAAKQAARVEQLQELVDALSQRLRLQQDQLIRLQEILAEREECKKPGVSDLAGDQAA